MSNVAAGTHIDREHPRYAHEAAIGVRVGGATHQGRTTNVSRGGLCADLAADIAVGTEVEIDMQLVFEDDVQSDALRLPARVVWCTTVDDGWQVGFAFKPLTAEQVKYVSLFLKYLDDGSQPAKRPRDSERSVDDRFG